MDLQTLRRNAFPAQQPNCCLLSPLACPFFVLSHHRLHQFTHSC